MQYKLIQIKKIFNKSKIRKYDFSKIHFIYRKTNKVNNKKWIAFQFLYLFWAKWSYFTNALAINNKRQFEKNLWLALTSIFKKLGYLEGNVLDLGGGSGSYRSFWKVLQNKIYLIHDPQIGNFEFLKLNNEPVYMVADYAEQLPYKDNVFDTVVIADAIDHFFNPIQALKESARVLKRGGEIMIFQCYRVTDQENFILTIVQKLKILVNQNIHINNMTHEDIKNTLREVGFLKIKIYKRKIKHNPINFIVYIAKN